MRTGAAVLFAALCAAPLRAQTHETVLKAMADEMARSLARLEMEKLGRPYFIAYTVLDSRRLELEASFGALRDPHETASRQAKVDLRVGSPSFDNAHYVGNDYWRYRPFAAQLPLEDDYDATRFALWTLTDEAYKHAVQKLAQKDAYRRSRMISDKVDDLSRDPKAVSVAPPAPAAFDRALWEERVRRLSAVFRRHPRIQASSVGLYWTRRSVYFLDSEGRRVLQPADDYELVLQAATQAADGHGVGDRRRIIRQELSRMPAMAELEAAAERLAADVTALADAPVVENYLGPVLFEGQAAGEFFNQLLARNISAPRSVWVENEQVKEAFAGGKLVDRIGLRAVSPEFDVEDDPALAEFEGEPLIGRYAIDDQGVPARRVSIVEKGILKGLPMSRSPAKGLSGSNGHGRADFHEFPTGRIGNLLIRSSKTLPEAALRAELARAAKEFGLPYGLLIRRVAEQDHQDKGELLAPPTLAYRVYPDGREELVRSVRFSNVTLRALRDITAASEKRHVYNYYQLGPYQTGGGQAQASIVHPSVLLSEMELKKTERKPERPPYLKHPHFAP